MSSGTEKFSVVFCKTGVSWQKWQWAEDCSTHARLQLQMPGRRCIFNIRVPENRTSPHITTHQPHITAHHHFWAQLYHTAPWEDRTSICLETAHHRTSTYRILVSACNSN